MRIDHDPAHPDTPPIRNINGLIGDLPLARDGVLQALCDCRIEAHVHGPDGATVGIARAGRNIPGYLRRVIHRRDHTCRFPGYERQIRHIHHIDHWVHSGTTNADNLIGLCWTHHTLVHDDEWTIHGHPDHTLTFHGRDHRRLWTSRASPIKPEVRQMLETALRRDAGP